MDINEIAKSKKFPPLRRAGIIAILVAGFFFVVFVSFAGGVLVGLKKARFSYKWGENYERNFVGGPFQGPIGGMMGPGPRDMMRGFEGRGFRNAHGIAGTIISVTDNKIVIKDRDGQENTISVSEKTLIKRGQDTISINDLKNDDRIVVMGSPDDNGVVNADLVRVFSASENK
ncbi:MAG: hypothetical protein A3J76_05465 [Candidatus Moranbacteria bacterium RBG_13_45_13]|nr:MAG: hypothetical protein A3J76_05465 [Candidatus Moranbacteria bacterium RBG_13_45_13]